MLAIKASANHIKDIVKEGIRDLWNISRFAHLVKDIACHKSDRVSNLKYEKFFIFQEDTGAES